MLFYFTAASSTMPHLRNNGAAWPFKEEIAQVFFNGHLVISIMVNFLSLYAAVIQI